MFTPSRYLLLAGAATIMALGVAGCGDHHPSTSAHATDDPATVSASDGATAIFRADVGPILCRYAQDITKSTRLIAKAAIDAGGPIDASAPQSAQAAYASALQLYAHLLASDYTAFAKVHAPAPHTHEYRQFLKIAGEHRPASRSAREIRPRTQLHSDRQRAEPADPKCWATRVPQRRDHQLRRFHRLSGWQLAGPREARVREP